MKVLKSFPFLLFLLLLISSCSKNYTLEEDPIVQEVYSESEIKELRKILNWFDSLVRTNELDNPILNFENYLEKMKDSLSYGKYELTISIEQNQEFIAQMDSNIKKDIWVGLGDRSKSPLGVNYITALNLEGKFGELLKRLGEKDSVMWYFNNYMHIDGGWSNTDSKYLEVIFNYDYYNFKREVIQLQLMILHITSLDNLHQELLTKKEKDQKKRIEKNCLQYVKEYAESFFPDSSSSASPKNAPDSIVSSFLALKTTDHNLFEKYLTLVFIKIYRAHLQCCHQSYELRGKVPKNNKDTLVKEFIEMVKYFPLEKDHEFIPSHIAKKWVNENHKLMKYDLIKNEMNTINEISENIRKGIYWED